MQEETPKVPPHAKPESDAADRPTHPERRRLLGGLAFAVVILEGV